VFNLVLHYYGIEDYHHRRLTAVVIAADNRCYFVDYRWISEFSSRSRP